VAGRALGGGGRGVEAALGDGDLVALLGKVQGRDEAGRAGADD